MSRLAAARTVLPKQRGGKNEDFAHEPAGVRGLPAGSLAAPVAVRAQDQNIPVMTLRAALKLPPDKLPTMFRSPNPYQHEPYNIHRTDGLSRNPDDCMRWGCIDHR